MHCFARHNFFSVRSGIHVTMFAYLVAHFSDVDLKNMRANRYMAVYVLMAIVLLFKQTGLFAAHRG